MSKKMATRCYYEAGWTRRAAHLPVFPTQTLALSGQTFFGLAICLRSDIIPWNPCRKKRFRLKRFTAKGPVTMRTVHRPLDLADLVRDFDDGKITLPLMQRDFVWRPKKARALFESLARGFPIGSFYLWTSEKPQLTKREDQSTGRTLLLDGQQRLTSLMKGIAPEGTSDQAYRAYLDIVNDTFVMGDESRTVTKRISANDATLIPLSELISVKTQREVDRLKNVEVILRGLQDAGIIRKENSETAIKYKARLGEISKLFARPAPCEDVCFDGSDGDEVSVAIEIFSRLNKGGKGLDVGDVRAANLAQEKTASILPRMREFMKKDQIRDLNLNFVFVTRTLATLHRGDASFTTESKKRGENTFWDPNRNEDMKDIVWTWGKTQKSLSAVTDFVIQDLGWASRRWLPSANALIPIAYLLKKRAEPRINKKDHTALTRYLCKAAVGRLFSGSVETSINQFLVSIKKAHREKAAISAELLLKGIRRDDVEPLTADTILAETPMYSPLMSVYLAYLISINAQSWWSGKRLLNVARDKGDPLAVHHIFPRNYLKSVGVPEIKANTMANYAFLSQSDNVQLTDEDPQSAYRRLSIQQKQWAQPQLFLIADPELFNDFTEFMQRRARKLAECLNEFLGFS